MPMNNLPNGMGVPPNLPNRVHPNFAALTLNSSPRTGGGLAEGVRGLGYSPIPLYPLILGGLHRIPQ